MNDAGSATYALRDHGKNAYGLPILYTQPMFLLSILGLFIIVICLYNYILNVFVFCKIIADLISYMAVEEVGKMALMVVDKPYDSGTETKRQLRVLDEDTYLEVQ